jgi:hypothetical protein
VIELLYSAYSEYKEFSTYGTKKSNNKFKLLKNILILLIDIFAITYYSPTGLLSMKAIKPMTKLLLTVTNNGTNGAKTRILRIMGFVISMTSKIKHKFNL